MKLMSSKTTIAIIAANLAVYFAAVASTHFTSVLLLKPPLLLKFGANFAPYTIALEQYWRLFAAAFIHRGPIHLSMNIWALAVLGPMLEELIGSKRYLVALLLSIIGGSLASILWDPTVISCGISGGIFGMLGCYAICIWMRGKLDASQKKSVSSIVVIAIAMYAVLLGLVTPGTDNANHIGGLQIGMILGSWCALSPMPAKKWQHLATISLLLGFSIPVGLFLWERTTLSHDSRLHVLAIEQQAASLASDHKNIEALNLINDALKKYPETVSLLGTRAPILMELKRFPEVIEDCNKVLAVENNDQAILLTRSIANHHTGNEKAAILDLDIAIRLNPEKALAYNNRAWSYAAMHEYDKALADIDKAIALDKGLSTSHDTKAVILYGMGRLQDALNAVNNAITLKKDDGAFYYHRAGILTFTGKVEEAKTDISKAITLGYKPEPWERQLFNLSLDQSRLP